ncbi:Methyl-accepting chemotaxis protein I (serine chemoreceptor protein) [Variovorax sp. WDL1]|nr:Methyl-accepting chemotaxis protein I (serine chemoreceptor protein) [Variovorax sp. WDL1]
MDQVTQQNAALVEEAAAAAQSMQEQAGSLVEAVSVFKLEDRAPALVFAHDPQARRATADN